MDESGFASARERAEITAACRRFNDMAHRTDPVDELSCRQAVLAGYRHLSVPEPEIRFADSPSAALAQLQRLGPEPLVDLPRPVPDLEAVLQDGTSLAGVWGVIAAAQPRVWPALGKEQDLSFHYEVNRAIEPFTWEFSWWNDVNKRVHQKTLNVLRLSHAVNNSLEGQVSRERDAWLLYTQASSSAWSEVTEHAALEVLVAIGRVQTVPAHYLLAREVLHSCGWLYSFDRLCIVCQRPAQIDWLDGPPRKGRTALIRWRDGSESTFVPD